MVNSRNLYKMLKNVYLYLSSLHLEDYPTNMSFELIYSPSLDYNGLKFGRSNDTMIKHFKTSKIYNF